MVIIIIIRFQNKWLRYSIMEICNVKKAAYKDLHAERVAYISAE